MRLTILAVLTLSAACRDAAPAQEFDSAAALRYLEQQVAFGYRIPGSEGHARTAAWLDSLLRGRADTLVVQAWTHRTARGDTLSLRNYLARFNPAARDRVLFLAHWDTRPRADNPKYSADKTRPVPGANDGASGTAVLLAMADALHRRAPRVGVDLLFVDGEDYGDFQQEPGDVLIGSRYYASHLPAGPPPLFAVLLDLVADRDLQIYEEGNSLTGAPEVVELVWRTARELGDGQYFIGQPRHTLIDDHVELQKVGIRAIDVVDFDYGPDNSYWHTINDTVDKVGAPSLLVVGNVAMAVIRGQ
jgi:hypothetical protein